MRVPITDTDEVRMPEEERHAGWYQDPEQPLRHRYWNGEEWLAEGELLDEVPQADEPDEPDAGAPTV